MPVAAPPPSETHVAQTPAAPEPPAAPGTPASSTPTPPPAETPAPPVVWSAPIAVDIPCGNIRLVFDFAPALTGYSLSNAFWMMWAAMRSFDSEKEATREELASVGFANYAAFDDTATSLQAYVAGSDTAVILAFRGSTDLRDWIGNFDFPERDGAGVGQVGRVHEGFANAMEPSFAAIASAIERFSQGKKERPALYVTGHSLGGAMATLAAARLQHTGHPVRALYTFAAPRSGDTVFANDAWAALDHQHFRFVNEKDLVPRLPPSGKAAAAAGALGQIEFAQKGLETLLRKMDYAHSGALYKFDTASHLTALPPMNEDDDVAYWGELAAHSANGQILNLITDNAEQATRHSEKTYLCKMRDAYLSAKPH